MAIKFVFGQTVITPGALNALSAEVVRVSLARHGNGERTVPDERVD